MQIDFLREISLELVLARLGAVRDTYDRTKWHTDRGTVVVERKGILFNSFDGSGVKGRGAVDLVIQLRQVQFREAIRWLSDNFSGSSDSARLPEEPELGLRTEAAGLEPRLCGIPRPSPYHWPRVREYLTDLRHLDAKLIDQLNQDGVVFADDRGNAVFRHGNSGCELRGTGQSRFAGSRGRKTGFVIPGEQGAETWLVESAIDAISVKQLRPNAQVISTGGDNAGLERACLAGIKGLLVIGYDNDPAGDRMAQRSQLTRSDVIRLLPSGGKDWNEALQRAGCSLIVLAREIQTALSLHGIPVETDF
jgi:Toprim-like